MIIPTLVHSLNTNRQYLRSKMFLCKKLIDCFNFKTAKQFLEVIQTQINFKSIDNNLLSHSCNPLLNMCLLYELLFSISNKFYSLNNMCRNIRKTTMDMAIQYIECVDEENFLTAIMLEKDF